MRFHSRLITAASLALVPSVAPAEDLQGRWSLGVQGGTDIELSGDVHRAGTGTVVGLPTTVEARSFSDIYDRSPRWQVALGYGVGPRSELLLKGSYHKARAQTVPVGNVAGLGLNANFADRKEWGLEAAYRQYFSEKRFRPYAGMSAGMRFVNAQPSTFSVPAAGVVLDDVPFFEESRVGVFGASIGVAVDLDRRLAIGVETGPRYQTKPGRLNGLAGTGLESINDAGSRWSMPVLGTVTLRF